MSATWGGCAGFGSHPALLDRVCDDFAGQWTVLDGADPGQPLPGEAVERAVIAARTPADLRRLVPFGALVPDAAQVCVVIAEAPPWAAQPLPVAGQSAAWHLLADMRILRRRRGWRIEATFSAPVPGGEILAHILYGLLGGRRHLAQPVVGLAGEGAFGWRPGDPNVTLTGVDGPVVARRDAPGCDLVLRVVDRTDRPWPDGRIPVVERAPLTAVPDGPAYPDLLPPVDETVVNPIGFRQNARGPVATLTRRAGGYSITSGLDELVRLSPSGELTDVDVARLRDAVGVAVREPDPSGLVRARIVTGLAAAGIPVLMDGDGIGDPALGAELSDALATVDEDQLASELRREEISVRLRRAALRTHGAIPRWRNIAVSAGLALPHEPPVSVLLCTCRKDMVPFALEQMERQRGVRAEVILGLHGFSAREAGVQGAIADSSLRITVVEAAAGVPFGELLNRMAAVASGSFLARVDDDDWYGPDHLADLLLAQRYSGAELVGAAAEFVYLEPINTTVRRRLGTERFTSLVAGATMLVTREMFETVGGFRPIGTTVDGQLLESVEAAGGRIYRTHGLNYVLRRRHSRAHTWRHPVQAFLKSYQEQWRGLHFNHLMESASTPHVGYWRQEP
ncbi:glycosyltransferase [Microtetraspora niveoalba]|uniref:glycosyltransferase n=1 Tax=Microtetraspora niveoalba TaxID=46175 RepID=UPI000ADAA1CB|nr:glycosyl transferase family 2 [Microtetraspora niveoalba]